MTNQSNPAETGLLQPRTAAITGPRIRWRRLAPYLFSAPALLLHVFVVLIPSVFTFVIAFYKWNGLSEPEYVGLNNFQTMLVEDHVFWTAFFNNVKWMLFFLTVPVIMGLGSAQLISVIKRGQIFYRTVFYLPATLASIVVARLWQWIYHPFSGLNNWFNQVNLEFLALNWLSSPILALFSVAFADNWRWWGFLSVIFLAALTQIDPTLHEAAALDGANAWQRFRYVTLPILQPTLIFVWLITILGSFQTFDMIFVMTRGGPGNSSQTLATWIYFQFLNNFSSGYASAIAVTTTVILSAIIAGYVYLRVKGWEV